MSKAKKQKQPRRTKHVAQRTCVVCREQYDKRQLTRIVRTPDAGVIVDLSGKRNGRGAYLCDQVSCWEKALSHLQILNKALLANIMPEEAAAIAEHKPDKAQREEAEYGKD